jgi:Leucine-rich repeat (LRR) protein
MKTALNYFMAGCTVLALVFTSCSKDEDLIPVVKSSAKQVISFVFLPTTNPIDVNVIGTINEGAKTIRATMPPGTNISILLPDIVIPSNAEVSPNTTQDFTNPVIYTVRAEDGSEVIYTATVIAPLSQRQILQVILDANPTNILGWDLTNTADLGTLTGVTTDVDGDIVALSFAGKKLTQFPPEIGLLTNLTNLNMGDNQLSSIPPEIRNLTNLTRLILIDNQLTSIPPEIGQLTNLTKLEFNRNQLTSIPTEIGNLTNLTALDLRSNQLTSIPVEIGQLTNLIFLSLNFNQLTTLPAEIGNLTNLTFLAIVSNQLTSIPPEMGQLINLPALHLDENQLTSIPPEIGFLTELQYLGIEGNNLTTIPQAICYLEEFNEMSISRDAGVLCKTVSEKDALISIYSANPDNALAWSVGSFPGVSFNDSGSPEVITMNNKNLSRLPGNLDQLTSLKTLHASQNPFGSIPSSIGNIGTLGVLTLHKTNLSTVPSELGQLTNLALLTLTDNPITSIPKSVCDRQISKGGILTILTDSGEGCD